jgi:aminoglycoside phosphotransferase family enzyme/predicted kinase
MLKNLSIHGWYDSPDTSGKGIMTHSKLVHAMSRPDFYGHNPDSVQLLQTHISFIFIAGDLVYKVKKAVDFGFLDFTTLEKRKFYCDEELRLNRRLASEIYLEVVPIGEDESGNLSLGAGNTIIDYAVKMKRLPEEKMLNRLISEGKVDDSVMDRVAKRVYEFHREAATGGEIDRIGGIDTIRHNHNENFEQTVQYIGTSIDRDRHQFIQSYAENFLNKNSELFEERVAGHRIRDCHGDLHLQHICIGDEILVFDCIEFNERFRYLDVAAEVAFLSMDLDFNGYHGYASTFVTSYLRYSSDSNIKKLLNFYKCYFAYVRGKVTSFKLDDDAIDKREKKEAIEMASRYFELASGYAALLEKPTIILMTGLMGTGKSVLAERLASLLGAEILRTDVIRKKLLDIPSVEHHFEEFGEGIYSKEMSERTYGEALKMAESIIKKGGSVIVDASFKKKAKRNNFSSLARKVGADFFIIECTCPEDTIKLRLEQRLLNKEEASDGRWEIFQAQKKDFDRIDEALPEVHIIIDTSKAPEKCASEAVSRMRISGSIIR